jgi:hypothetical protein
MRAAPPQESPAWPNAKARCSCHEQRALLRQIESGCSPKVSVQKDYVAERLPPTDDQMFAYVLVRFPPGEPRPRGSILIVVVVLAPVKLLYQGSLNLG